MDNLALSLFFSLAGMGAFAYGRKSGRMVPVIGGVILMVYPYFIPNPVAMAVIGVGVVIGTIVLRDALE